MITTIYKAQPIGSQTVPNLVLNITEPFPETTKGLGLGPLLELHEKCGRLLHAKLSASLPGGTLDALLRCLLQTRASHLVVLQESQSRAKPETAMHIADRWADEVIRTETLRGAAILDRFYLVDDVGSWLKDPEQASDDVRAAVRWLVDRRAAELGRDENGFCFVRLLTTLTPTEISNG